MYSCKHTTQNAHLGVNIDRISVTASTFVHAKVACYWKNDVHTGARGTFIQFDVLLLITQHYRLIC